MMSHEFLNTAYGDWYLSHANDNDTIVQNHPVMPDIFELPSSFDPNPFYTKVQHCRYLCGACGENILEQNLTEHHASQHPGTPFIIEMYELFEIDERFKCEICDMEQFEADLKEHLTDCHRQEVINYYYTPYEPSPPLLPPLPPPQPMPLMPLMAVDTFNDDNQPIADNEVMTVPGHFLCLACGVSSIRQNNLQKHRKKLHANIPHRVNIFAQQPDRQKFKCSICEKWLFEKAIEKHCMKYHPDKYDDKHSYGSPAAAAAKAAAVADGTTTTTPPPNVPATDGFRNIRVSNTEFQRLQNKNQIYEFNGIQYLKDSN